MVEQRHDDGRYYGKGGMVWKSPVKRDLGDGRTGFSIGFPVCGMHEVVGDDAADTVAELMNRGDQFEALVAALQAAEDLHQVGLFDAAPGQVEQVAQLRRDALAKARATSPSGGRDQDRGRQP